MASQTVFQRYELKFLLTIPQKEALLRVMEPYMSIDRFGRDSIRNIYFDTDNYRLIRRSIERPDYKEKLRIRSYGRATPDHPVYVELKKKYDHVVYKRRVKLPEKEAMDWICGRSHCAERGQISREVDYFMQYYKSLRPVVFLSYEREAYYSLDGSDFRVTFDDNILCRQQDLSLESEVWGTPVLDPELVMMEIKCSGGIPMWMTRFLSTNKIYKTSFSKYGIAYQTLIFPKLKEESIHA